MVAAIPPARRRGLFRSDGCRVDDWTRKVVAGQMERYHYGRWQFVDASDDIRARGTRALDLGGRPDGLISSCDGRPGPPR